MTHPSGSERHSVAPPSAESSRDIVHEDFLFHLYRGSELLQENRVLEAKEELEFALTVQPLDAKGQDLLGTVYFRLGLYPRAIQIYEALEPQFPRDTSIKINLALAYLKTGQAELARRVLRDAVALQPDHKRAWGYLGLALQKLGELDQAQAAFERGGHTLMAKRVVERRRQSLAPVSIAPQSVPAGAVAAGGGLPGGVREVAEAAFSELESGELRFSLARAEQPRPGDGPWHSVEIGGVTPPAAPVIQTMPPSPTAVELRSVHESVTVPPPKSGIPAEARGEGAAVSAGVRTGASVGAGAGADAVAVAGAVAVAVAPPLVSAAPPPLASTGDARIGMAGGGALVARTGEGPGESLAGRLEAVRVVAGAVTTRVLHRRRDDIDLNEVLGGIGSPMVLIQGDCQVVLGPRPGFSVSLVQVADGAACVLEDRLLAFASSLEYDCGRIVFEYPGERPRSGPEGNAVVQLRGTGVLALELAGTLASIESSPSRPLLVRREWIVGWLGRLVAHPLPPAEAPGGQRGLIGFAGEGTVLVCVG